MLVLTLVSLAKGIPEQGLIDALANVYFADGLAMTLFYAQSAALLEIVHAALGLVRSPVLVTAMQVGSRLVALAAVVLSPQAQGMFVCIYGNMCVCMMCRWRCACGDVCVC